MKVERVETPADILQCAMEGIGPLDIDCSDAHGDGADGDKMTIDLSAHSDVSDHNIDSPPFNKSPTEHTPPSSAKHTPPNSAEKKTSKTTGKCSQFNSAA